MSVSASERWQDFKLVENIDGNWTATRAFDVVGFGLTGGVPNVTAAIIATGVSVGQAHPLESAIVCTSIGVTENSLTKCVVVANYGVSTLVPNDPNPLLRAPVVSRRPGKESQPIDTDINGNPIINSANDGFGQNAAKNYSVEYFTIKRWESSYNQSLADQYRDTTNSDNVSICGNSFSPGQLYLLNYNPLEEYQVGGNYVHVSYNFEVRTPNSSGLTSLQIRYPFQLRVLDQGLRAQYQDPNNSNTKTLGDLWLGGSQPSKCLRNVLLNGQGQPVDSTIVVTQAGYTAVSQTLASTIQLDSTSSAKFLVFMRYPELAFAGLGLPT